VRKKIERPSGISTGQSQTIYYTVFYRGGGGGKPLSKVRTEGIPGVRFFRLENLSVKKKKKGKCRRMMGKMEGEVRGGMRNAERGSAKKGLNKNLWKGYISEGYVGTKGGRKEKT